MISLNDLPEFPAAPTQEYGDQEPLCKSILVADVTMQRAPSCVTVSREGRFADWQSSSFSGVFHKFFPWHLTFRCRIRLQFTLRRCKVCVSNTLQVDARLTGLPTLTVFLFLSVLSCSADLFILSHQHSLCCRCRGVLKSDGVTVLSVQSCVAHVVSRDDLLSSVFCCSVCRNR